MAEDSYNLVYSEKVLDHFQNPRNAGVVPDYNGIGKIGDPSCGDMCIITLRVEKERIADIKFKVYGCAGAIATSSAVTELALGKNTDEALQITDDDVVTYLDGLPERKKHCSLLAVQALQQAIYDYWLFEQLKKEGQVKNRQEYDEIREEIRQGILAQYAGYE
ncbi:MAG: iron-sulfur cluster assembly scaffold protein [Bacillota bacterium]|uniref:iron-sulfur cluster assembly scaffold protein n=1 Tax=Desulfurispora thermophila TaxID=265470 RepID=UPI00035ECC1A|nr:iron-sulfur cluster assembly scaffold protein [Desulfurispora thermophila]